MTGKYKKIIEIAGITLAVFVTLRYFLPFVVPFFAAYLLVRILNPLAAKIQEKIHIKKEINIVILLVLITSLLGLGLWFLMVKLFEQVRMVVENIELYEKSVQGIIDGCCTAAQNTFGVEREIARAFITKNIVVIQERIQVYMIPNFFNNSLHYMFSVLKFFGGFFLIFIAVILMVKDYDAVKEKLEEYTGYRSVMRIINRLWELGGAYLKAQGIIIIVVITLCVLGLWILKNPYALLVGILIGLLDALPFIGTGTVLLPWAVICLIQGDFFHAASYATLFLVTNTSREYLEPKLLGNKLGVYPIIIAMVVYAGICIYGAWGVLLGPFTLLLIMEIIREIERE